MNENAKIHILLAMRRWLLTFLLFILPMQFAFAGAVNCYQAKFKATGLHSVQSPEAATLASAVDNGSPGDEAESPDAQLSHCECSACHLTGAQPAVGLAVVTPPLHKSRLLPPPSEGMLPDVAGLIDRPNWNRAA